MASLLLVDLRSPINFGMCLRLAETFAINVLAYDPSKMTQVAEKRGTISDFACGALERKGFVLIDDLDAWVRPKSVRLVASSIEASAAPLETFSFLQSDIIAVGNEYDGLAEHFVAGADAVVRISMADVWTPKPRAAQPIDPTRARSVARDGSPSLNVAISAGILCHAAYSSLR